MKSLTEQLAEIKERADKATEGPWFQVVRGVIEHELPDKNDNGTICSVIDNIDRDLPFIAHARTDVPKLLAVIEKLIGLTDVMIEGKGTAVYSDKSWNLKSIENEKKLRDEYLAKILEGEK